MFAAQALDPRTTRRLPKPDIILGGTVDPLAAATGGRLAARHKVPFVYEIRDLWPETLIRLGRLKPSHPAARLLYRMERKSWNQAALVVGPLGRIPEYAKDRGLPPRPFVHVPNGVDLEAFGPPPPAQSGVLRIGYFGSHGLTDHLDVLLEAFATPEVRMLGGSVELQLFGAGPHKESLRSQATEQGLANVTFHDPLPRPQVAAAMQSMSALAFPLADNGGLYRYGACPNKLAEYLAAGRPVLLNAPFAPDPVLDAGGVVTVELCDAASWSEAICQLAATPQADRIQMGQLNREYAVANSGFEQIGHKLDTALLAALAKS